MNLYPFKPPFSYEFLKDQAVYRIRDSQDNAVCRTSVEENAQIVVAALNGVGK